MTGSEQSNKKVSQRSVVTLVSATSGLARLVGASWPAIIGRDRLLLSARGYVGKGGFARVIQVPARYTFLSAVPNGKEILFFGVQKNPEKNLDKK